jgi:diguanylate cyclase (GGDEF)-like protein
MLARLVRILWPFASLWLLLAGAVLLISLLEIRADRAAAIEEAHQDAESFAEAARMRVAETLDRYDRTLSLFKLAHERRMMAQPLTALAETLRLGSGGGARRIDQYDREGRLVASTDPERYSAPASIAERRHFEDARAIGSGDLQLAQPITAGKSGAFAIPVVKRLDTAEGGFDGVLVSTLDPAELRAAIRSLAASDRMILGLVDRNGRIYAANAGVVAGTADPLLALGATSQGGSSELISVAGRPSLVARAEIPGRDLVVFAAVDEDAMFVAHRRHARMTLVFACLTLAAITLAILLVGRRALLERDRRRQLERQYEEVRSRASTDPLTGVANRAAFDDQLRVAHAILAADGRPFVLAFIDIDRFKALNDKYGHAIGDRVLKRVGKILREGVRNDDAVARLGGDEFAVLMPGGNALAMRRVFEPLRELLKTMVADEKWPITFSIGVVAFESAPRRPRDAINLADRTMYEVKSHGRDGARYAIYREGALMPDFELAQSAA